MRTLVLGGTGIVGGALAGELRRRGAAVLALSRAQADLTARADLLAWVERFRPEVVVNCAAFTGVDACEEQRDRALAVNGHAVANAVAAAATVGAQLIQPSSDYVFDGAAASPYVEEAATAPLSVYGESKLLGERQALAYERGLVVRTSWVFGERGANFVATLVRQMNAGRRVLSVVADQLGAPTYAPFLAAALADLAARRASGVVHFRNREPVSWHGFACEIARQWDPEVRVEAVGTADMPRPARRPAYSVLDVSKYERLVGRPVEPWIRGLSEYLEGLRARRY